MLIYKAGIIIQNKMRTFYIILSVILHSFITEQANAQFKLGDNTTTTNKAAVLDLQGSNGKQGLWLPRITDTTNATGIDGLNPPDGMLIYHVPSQTIMLRVNGYWASLLAGKDTNNWQTKGNSGTSAVTNFIGTTDNTDLVVKTNSVEQARIKTDGKVGIGTNSPNALLAVNGTVSLGQQGTVINNVIRFTNLTAAVPAIAGFGSTAVTVTVSGGVTAGSSVIINPTADIPTGISIIAAYAPSANQIRIQLANSSSTSVFGFVVGVSSSSFTLNFNAMVVN